MDDNPANDSSERVGENQKPVVITRRSAETRTFSVRKPGITMIGMVNEAIKNASANRVRIRLRHRKNKLGAKTTKANIHSAYRPAELCMMILPSAWPVTLAPEKMSM